MEGIIARDGGRGSAIVACLLSTGLPFVVARDVLGVIDCEAPALGEHGLLDKADQGACERKADEEGMVL